MMWRILLLVWFGRWTSALELLGVEPGVKCSCELANVVSFTAVHARNSSGQWNTEIAVERGVCSFDQPITSPAALMVSGGDKPRVWGYEYFPSVGSFFKHHTVTATWYEARRTCELEGAHLAIVNSEEESQILAEIYKRSPSILNAKWDFAFVGFHDIYDEGTYITIFGEPLFSLGFVRIWNKGEGDLNNMGQNDVNSGQDCGSIHRNGGLNDLNCDIRHSFFCEIETRKYPPPSEVDYSASAYRSLQAEKKPRNGTVPRKRPGPGYELFENVGFYKMHTTPTTWHNARRICQDEGGHLAIVNSDVEAQVLKTLFERAPNLKMVLSNDFALIGFHDIYAEGQYRTIFDEQLVMQGYYNWRPGTPDNAGHNNLSPGQDCGAISRQGQLDDIDCDNHYAFFCEQELMI